MSDRILFSSDGLSGIARQLGALADAIGSARSGLSDLHMTSENGGELDLSDRSIRLSHASFSGGSTAAARLQALLRSMQAEEAHVRATVQTINGVIDLFEAAENQVSKLADAFLSGDAELSPEAQALQEEQMEAIRQMLKLLQLDYSNFNGFVNRDKLDNMTGFLGMFYTTASGNIADGLPKGAHDLMLALYSSISTGGQKGIVSHAVDGASDFADNFDSAKDIAVDLVTVLSDGELGANFEAFLDDLPLAGKFNVKSLDDLKNNLDVAKQLLNAYREYSSIRSADPARLASICSGLRSSGDPMLSQTAALMEQLKDPTFAKAYVLASNGLDLAADKLSSAAQKALAKTAPGAVVAAGQEISEKLANASELVSCAQQIKCMDNARMTAYQTAVNAMNDYLANPSDAAYQAAVDAKNVYYALTAETVDSMKSLAEAQNDSILGTFDHTDTAGFDRLAADYRSRMS